MSDQEHEEDARPKPKFGELAPEGWTWSPPEDQDRLDTSRGARAEDPDEAADDASGGQAGDAGPASTDSGRAGPMGTGPAGTGHGGTGPGGTGPGAPFDPGASPSGWPPPHQAYGAPQGLRYYADGATHPRRGALPTGGIRPAPVWNRPLTMVLILIGLLGALFTISTLAALPESMQLFYTSQKLGTYHAPASLHAIVLAGQIVQGLLWAASLTVSALLMARQRISFYVPLIAGFLAAIALVVFIAIVIAGDPTLMHAYSGA